MKKNPRKIPRPAAFVAMLTVLCLALLTTGYAQSQKVADLSVQIGATYQKALYETGELTGGAQLTLEKLMVSSSASHEIVLLQDIARQLGGARDNLSILPQAGAGLESAMRFVNQASDLCRVLAEKMTNGGTMDDADRERLRMIYDGFVTLNGQLRAAIDALDRGELTVTLDQAGMNALPQAGDTETEPLVDYPVLLYDGPFSEANDEGEIRAGGDPVTIDEAQEKLLEVIGRDRVTAIRRYGESNIFAACYEFEADTESGVISAGVTRAGGHILYMLPASGGGDIVLSAGECIDLAARFLENNGYGPMTVSYWRRQDGLLTVNFAATQDGVILYPDLVKLQVSMESGLIVGLEAGNYLRNHAPRALPERTLTAEDARALVNPALNIERTRLCVIPLETSEACCWELTARFPGGNRYLIYLDAETGDEKTILQVVEDDEGIMTQ